MHCPASSALVLAVLATFAAAAPALDGRAHLVARATHNPDPKATSPAVEEMRAHLVKRATRNPDPKATSTAVEERRAQLVARATYSPDPKATAAVA
ncbi:hypothetical protein BV25DRAFT_1922698 [Artomyces pyxidatus]|uniref:Uncharacterized protein n=1 Tax=Artomyces pyxidatus TaxID=48021 RepID=A0ACB8SD84_9AGAM|nr:hypothetical protein BV25DRAFT_1922698 [Artomyces pyxidatus]